MAPSRLTATSSTRNSGARRTIERQTPSSRRRRANSKPNDPLELLAVVVSTARGSSKFICPLCASTFGRRCELKRHVAEVHTLDGARRFACKHPACGKSFTRKDALAKHEIVKHQGKRKFVCSTCSEKFTSRYDLTRHNIRVHSNVKKRFTCEFCGAGFSQKSQLTMHKGRVHADAKPLCTDDTPSTPDTIQTSDTCASMDSLAAVAAAMAKEEEKQAKVKHLSENQSTCYTCSSRSGPPTHQREAVGSSTAKRTTPKEEAEAAAFAADTLLEAAAVLQPKTTESSFVTHVTDDVLPTIDGHLDISEIQDKGIFCPQTPNSIIEP